MASTLWDAVAYLGTPVTLTLLFVGYAITTAVYRLFFSPIAHFPGPKFAALTFW